MSIRGHVEKAISGYTLSYAHHRLRMRATMRKIRRHWESRWSPLGLLGHGLAATKLKRSCRAHQFWRRECRKHQISVGCDCERYMDALMIECWIGVGLYSELLLKSERVFVSASIEADTTFLSASIVFCLFVFSISSIKVMVGHQQGNLLAI